MKALLLSAFYILLFYVLGFQASSLKTDKKSEFKAKNSSALKNKAKPDKKSSVQKNKQPDAPKKNSNETAKKRSTANERSLSGWRRISLFSTPGHTLYESKNNSKMILSLQKEKAVPAEEREDGALFLKKIEQEKAIVLSSSALKSIKVSSARIENKEETSLFYIQGSYLGPVENQKIYYREWRFYTNEASIYILASLDEPIKENERKSIQTFIEEWLESSAPFSIKEKEFIFSFIESQELQKI